MTTPPQQGDVRLVDLPGPGAVTQTCNEVHYGGVEVFNRGRWGAVCATTTSSREVLDFTRVATVICGQLGFPVGSTFEVRQATGDLFGDEYFRFPDGDDMPSDIAWTTRVTCNATAQRLQDCRFAGGSDGTLVGQPEDGVNCAPILGVVCHRFEITGAASPTLTTVPVPLLPETK